MVFGICLAILVVINYNTFSLKNNDCRTLPIIYYIQYGIVKHGELMFKKKG